VPVIVEFYEADNNGGLIDAVEMAGAPQIGALIVFTVNGDRQVPLEVVSVTHMVDAKTERMGIHAKESAARCELRRLESSSHREAGLPSI
jgi:hypothetical protein